MGIRAWVILLSDLPWVILPCVIVIEIVIFPNLVKHWGLLQ